MATVVRDPRDIITPEAFRVADHLIGLPLAKPARRLWSILVDLLLVAILIKLLDAIALLLALAAAFIVFRLSRGGTGKWYNRFYRRGLGCFGAILAFIAILVVVDMLGDGDEDDERAATINTDSAEVAIEGMGATASMMLVRDGLSLRNATRAGERDTLATRMVERLASDGRLSRDGMLDAVEGLSGGDVMPAAAVVALQAAVETTTARLENRAPRSAAAIRAADSAAAAAADSAAAAGLLAQDTAIADSAFRAVRDTIADLANQLQATRTELQAEQGRRLAAEARVDEGALRWVMSSVADELGLGLGWLGLYFTAFTVLGGGQTPGKRLFRLRIIRLDGRPLGWWTALQRFGGYSASVFTGMLGFAEMFWDDNRQALQDKLVHTVVIQEAKRAEGSADSAWDLPEDEPDVTALAPVNPAAAPAPRTGVLPSAAVDPADGTEIAAAEDTKNFIPSPDEKGDA